MTRATGSRWRIGGRVASPNPTAKARSLSASCAATASHPVPGWDWRSCGRSSAAIVARYGCATDGGGLVVELVPPVHRRHDASMGGVRCALFLLLASMAAAVVHDYRSSRRERQPLTIYGNTDIAPA